MIRLKKHQSDKMRPLGKSIYLSLVLKRLMQRKCRRSNVAQMSKTTSRKGELRPLCAAAMKIMPRNTIRATERLNNMSTRMFCAAAPILLFSGRTTS